MTKQKHLKRHIRERMQKTGESYTTARFYLLGTVPAAPDRVLPERVGPARIRFRARRLSRRTPRPLGLRYVAPAFTIVISLVIGVAGFMALTAAHPAGAGSLHVTAGRP